MKAKERLSLEVITKIREAIADAQGNEIFVIGTIDSESRLTSEIKITARGTATQVPAIGAHLQKGDILLHNHPSGNLTPSNADLGIASRCGSGGVGFYIVDNDVEHIYVVAEAIALQQKESIDSSKLASILEQGGALSRSSDFFEERPSQIAMLKLICRAFNEDKIAIAEAGTGVGKSLAYLIPSIAWADANDERIVVSTGTINLQEQLFHKDIPLVKRLLRSDVKAVLVKGRGNYLCLHRLDEAMAESSLFEQEKNLEIEKISQWAENTQSGAKNDLSFYPSEEVWSRVKSETDGCLGLFCSYRESCFVLKARREASAAQILVTNHHLLFSDLALRLNQTGFDSPAVLPPFSKIVFDEAHNIEASATSFFSQSLNHFAVTRLLRRIIRFSGARQFGFLAGLQKILDDPTLGREIPELIKGLEGALKVFNHSCIMLLNNQFNLEIKPGLDYPILREQLEPALQEMESYIIQLHSVLIKLTKHVKPEEEENPLAFEAKQTANRLLELGEISKNFRSRDQAKQIYWVEQNRGYKGAPYGIINISPLSIAGYMAEAVYEPYSSVVFTSATLSIGNSFDYWRSRIGCRENVLSGNFPSPFDYKNRVLFGLTPDAPPPTSPEYENFLIQYILEVVSISQGRALILFTSYTLLKNVAHAIEAKLKSQGIILLCQGEDDRGRLLKQFQKQTSSVLLATDSFWEGVDAPGKALEILIITRLPFRVPSDPITQARMEDITQKGGNAFMDYSLPTAVLKLKQGFGRLMRRKTDQGIILLLDSRVTGKSYGRIFVQSLPIEPQAVKPARALLLDIENFVARMRSNEEE